jgi:dihydroneopterin aldolase
LDLPSTNLAPAVRVYVSDLVLPVRIGVHEHERHAPQKVRFGVAVEVGSESASPGTKGDYFSYDAIMDAIAEATSGGHVDLAETLAERIAGSILRDSRAERVTVKVEKLEIVQGILGIEQVFDRKQRRP